MCFKYDGSKVYGYKNGIQFASVTASDLNPQGSIILGRAYNGNDRYFSGQFGICYIYNRALTDSERLQMVKYIEQVQERNNSIKEVCEDVVIYTI